MPTNLEQAICFQFARATSSLEASQPSLQLLVLPCKVVDLQEGDRYLLFERGKKGETHNVPEVSRLDIPRTASS